MIKLALATATLALAPSVAVDVPAFTSIELAGGGDVVIRHGAVQRVTLTAEGDAPRMTVDGRKRLNIQPCAAPCDQRAVRIEITTPHALEAVAVRKGGRIRGEGAWPAQKDVAVAVSQGGEIDLTGIPAQSVAAAVNRGGTIRVSASSSLVAATSGGGTIAYRGDPSITRIVQNGGAVTRIRD